MPEESCSPLLETVPEYSAITTTSTTTRTTNTSVLAIISPELSVAKPKRKLAAAPVTPPVLKSEDVHSEEDNSSPTSPSAQRRSFLDTLRPRSKSDASYAKKRSSFLTQLKLKKTKHVSSERHKYFLICQVVNIFRSAQDTQTDP